jgi:hypothetical protein
MTTYPAWRFREEANSNKSDDGKQALQGQGKPELNRRVMDVRHAVIDPVGSHDSEDVDGQFD